MTCHTLRASTDIVTYRYNDELVYVPVVPNYAVSPCSPHSRFRLTATYSKRSHTHAKRSRSSKSCAACPSRSLWPPPDMHSSLLASARPRGPGLSRTCRATRSLTCTPRSRAARVGAGMRHQHQHPCRYRTSPSRMQIRTRRSLYLRIGSWRPTTTTKRCRVRVRVRYTQQNGIGSFTSSTQTCSAPLDVHCIRRRLGLPCCNRFSLRRYPVIISIHVTVLSSKLLRRNCIFFLVCFPLVVLPYDHISILLTEMCYLQRNSWKHPAIRPLPHRCG